MMSPDDFSRGFPTKRKQNIIELQGPAPFYFKIIHYHCLVHHKGLHIIIKSYISSLVIDLIEGALVMLTMPAVSIAAKIALIKFKILWINNCILLNTLLNKLLRNNIG